MTKWYELISNPVFTLDGTCSITGNSETKYVSLAHNPAVSRAASSSRSSGASNVISGIPPTIRKIRHPVTGDVELRRFLNPLVIDVIRNYGGYFLGNSNLNFPSNWAGYTVFIVVDSTLYANFNSAIRLGWSSADSKFIAYSDYPTRENEVRGHTPTSDEAIVLFASIDKTNNTCYLLTSTILLGTRTNEEQSGRFGFDMSTKITKEHTHMYLPNASGPQCLYAYGQWASAVPLVEGRVKVMELLDAISEKIDGSGSVIPNSSVPETIKNLGKFAPQVPLWNAGKFFHGPQPIMSTYSNKLPLAFTNKAVLDLTYNYYIEDIVTKDDSPISTRLMLYEKHLGTLLGYTYSDMAGKFKILNLERSVEYVVVAYDPDRQYASIIKDYSWGSPFMKRVRYSK